MLKSFLFAVAVLALAPLSNAQAAPLTGEMAPAITATDSITGEPFSLADQKGKIVVLEWTNNGCPFVRKHYDTNNMQTLQKNMTADGDVVWASIVSSAEGKQGYVSAEESNAIIAEEGAQPTVKILDPEGTIGQAYAAKTTPHMFVIDAEGVLRYQGAIDDDSSPRQSAVEGANNYVVAAVEALKNGTDITVAETQPYGCGVKY